MDFLQHTLDGLLEAGPYALVGLGLTLGFGVLRRVNLAYGAGAMLGAYAGSWLHVRVGWPAWAVLPVVAALTALAGMYVQWLCFAGTDRAVGTPQRAEHSLDAVAVSIGLDHRPDARVGRAHAGLVQVVFKGCRVDGGEDRAGHGNATGKGSRAQKGRVL